MMGKNSTRVVFEQVIDSKPVPRRVSAEQSVGSAFVCFQFQQETADASLRPSMTGAHFHQPARLA
jgi:hypothetical protein